MPLGVHPKSHLRDHVAEPPPPPPKALERTGRFRRGLTPEQAKAVQALGGSEDSIMFAATGSDVFVYVSRAGATLRFQVGADGDLIGQTRFPRAVAMR